MGIILLFINFACPLSNWLGGTILYNGDANFFVRNEALITFSGTVLTIIGIIISIINPWNSRKYDMTKIKVKKTKS